MRLLLKYCPLILSVLLLMVSPHLIAAETDKSVSTRMIDEARHILEIQKDAKYVHKTHVVESEGVFHLDCSGLVCHILKKVSPEHLKVIPIAENHTRALALQFYEAIVAAGEKGKDGWKRVEKVENAQPGDVLVWRLERKSKGRTRAMR